MFSEISMANKLKDQREKLHLRQIDLSNALQISPQAISKWERGEGAPDITLLVPLAKLLNVSVDWLLGYYDELTNVFEATVFISGILGYAEIVQTMKLRDAAIWTNGFLYQITESVKKYDAIPVKYLGEGLLCFFSGPNHQTRAINAAIDAKKIVGEKLYIGLNSGDIFLGAVGHPDYSSRDISGNTLNSVFPILFWARENVNSRIAAAASVVDKSNLSTNIGKSKMISLEGIEKEIEIYEIICN